MRPDVEREALRCFTRPELEGLQIYAKHLRDVVNRDAGTLPLRDIRNLQVVVNRNARTLPLRRIKEVYIGRGRVSLRSTEDNPDVYYDFVLPHSDQNPKGLFHRINNAFVDQLGFSFSPEDRPFLAFMRANADSLQCRVRVLCTHLFTATIDYATVDFLCCCLSPRVFSLETYAMGNEALEDYVTLYRRDVMRLCVSHVEFSIGRAPAPDYIIVDLLSTGLIETCNLTLETDPRSWIVKFSQAFGAVTRGRCMVRTVTVVFLRYGDSTSLPDAPTLALRDAMCVDVPTPNCAYVNEWIRSDSWSWNTKEFTRAKRFTYRNTMVEKKLDVTVWTVKHDIQGCVSGLHYLYLLRVTDL